MNQPWTWDIGTNYASPTNRELRTHHASFLIANYVGQTPVSLKSQTQRSSSRSTLAATPGSPTTRRLFCFNHRHTHQIPGLEKRVWMNSKPVCAPTVHESSVSEGKAVKRWDEQMRHDVAPSLLVSTTSHLTAQACSSPNAGELPRGNGLTGTILKKAARYLRGAPRAAQTFR